MKNAIFSGLQQVSSIQCATSALGILLLIFLGSSQMIILNLREPGLLPEGFVNTFFDSSLSQDAVVSFLPVLAVIPFAASYVDDLKGKFARFFLIRSGYVEYFLSRILVAVLWGGGAVTLGALTAWAGAALVFLPRQLVGEPTPELTSRILKKLLLLFCNGGLWSVVGMALSTVMESKYIAYISPFIVYYLLVILYERYFPDAWLLYPKNWLNPEIWPYGVESAVVFLLELTFFAGLLFYIRGRRRLESL